MKKQAIKMMICGIVGIGLSVFGGLCVHGCMKQSTANTSVFGIPIFIWGIMGYGTFVISYYLLHLLWQKFQFLVPLFFLIALSCGTATAISVSIKIGILCPFCFMAWVLNIFICTNLVHQLFSIRHNQA